MTPLLTLHRPEPAAVDQLTRVLGCHQAIAAILVNRGIRTPDQAHHFLFPKLGDLRPPFAMAGMAEAVARIVSAIINKEKILVFGDYDADGITAGLLLQAFLRLAGNGAGLYIPHRIEEGYGIKPLHITEMAAAAGVNLVITADCGASSHEAVAAAARCGIDVVVTDHHRQPEPLPPATAVVNPQRPDCAAGFEDLAGVGVAFYLTVCLRARLREMGFWSEGLPEPDLRRFCDLVALGTVADIVPMTGDNRILTRAGLSVINQGDRPGLAALTAASGLRLGQVTATDIAFRLAPRINAAGRVGHASLAVELLCASDPERARTICGQLDAMNTRRQELENDILHQIQGLTAGRPELLDVPALIFSDASWHPGVLGIVASRLARIHSRPAILLGIADGLAKGSGRSVPGVNLHACLEDCQALLEGFGGHAQAAGLSLRTERLEDFSARFVEAVTRRSRPEDFIPRIQADGVLAVEEVNVGFAEAVAGLGPFGPGNPEPVFLARDLEVVASRVLGGRHLKFTLRPEDRPLAAPVEAIQFNADPENAPPPPRLSQVAFRVNVNRWNGNRTAQMIVEAIWE